MTLYHLHKFFSKDDVREMEQFMRIAMARLRTTYQFKPQRVAVAAKMYSEWRKRKDKRYGEA
jgi:hypothetical protein